MMKLRADFGGLLISKLKNLDPNSVRFKQAQFFIGSHIRNLAIDNVTEQGAVDSGRLRSSIRFDIRETTNLSIMSVGVWGLPYARMVEYGGPFTDKMRAAMFARFKEEGKPKKPGKNIIRADWYQERPYMRPAIEDSQDYIEKEMERLVE